MTEVTAPLGSIRNLRPLSNGGWIWDVVEDDWESEEYKKRLVEHSTNTNGDGIWKTGEDYDGSTKYTQTEGTCQFSTRWGSQTRGAIRSRLARHFAPERW